MNKRQIHNLYAMMLLAVFMGGQALLFTHQHEMVRCCGLSDSHFTKKGYHNRTPEVKDCPLCDVITHKKICLASPWIVQFFATGIVLVHTRTVVFRFFEINAAQSRGPPTAWVQHP